MIPLAVDLHFKATRMDGSTYRVPVRVEGKYENECVTVTHALYATSGEDFIMTLEQLEEAEDALRKQVSAIIKIETQTERDLNVPVIAA